MSDGTKIAPPKRIQMRRTKGWRKPEGAIYVGRPTRWGNPYRVSGIFAEDILGEEPFADSSQHAVELFRQWWELYHTDLSPLRGHDLACWCHLCAAHADGKPLGVVCNDCDPCHADVLLELANS